MGHKLIAVCLFDHYFFNGFVVFQIGVTVIYISPSRRSPEISGRPDRQYWTWEEKWAAIFRLYLLTVFKLGKTCLKEEQCCPWMMLPAWHRSVLLQQLYAVVGCSGAAPGEPHLPASDKAFVKGIPQVQQQIWNGNTGSRRKACAQGMVDVSAPKASPTGIRNKH